MDFFFKKQFVFGAVALLGAGVVLYAVLKEEPSEIEFIVAKQHNIIQEVSVTGKVEPSKSARLAFEISGKVLRVPAQIGDRVVEGEVLVQLESGDKSAVLLQAEARVKIEQAKLDELLHGSTSEEIGVQEVKVENARTALAEEKRNLVLTLQDAYTKADDAVRNKVDQFISNPEGSNPQVTFAIVDPQLKTDIETRRVRVRQVLLVWKEHAALISIESDLIAATRIAKDNLDETKVFLDSVSLVVNAIKASSDISQTTINAYRSDVSTARVNINTALSNIVAAEKKVRDAESAFFLAEEELVLKRAPTRAEKVTAQEAKVEEAAAVVIEKQAALKKTTLLSPLAGIVTKQEIEVGEIVSANTVIVELISDATFEIKANIPEADIAKVSIGDSARTTLDAYGSDIVFNARVVSIDPAETIIEGVATYTTTFQFLKKDSRIFSGMTANVDIATGSRQNVIAIPARAVISKDRQKIVRVLRGDGTVDEVLVSVGLRGSFGNIEIIEGINEGDKVIMFIEE